MSESKTIARPYANACFEIAQESGNAEEWLLFLENAAEVVKDSAMLNLSLIHISEPTRPY